MNKITDKKRQIHLDWICGLLIVHMIIGHIIEKETSLADSSILWNFEKKLFSFFMPWFFFKSGMMFKSRQNLECIKISFRRYMVPFFFWGVLGIVISMILFIIFNQTPPINYTDIRHCLATGYLGESNGPLWYIQSLFLIVVFYNICFNNLISNIIIALSAVLFSTHIYYNGPEWLPVIPHFTIGLFYFVSGNALSEWQYGHKAVIVSIIILVPIICWEGISYIDIFAHNLVYGHYSLNYLYSLCIIIIFNKMVKYMPDEFFKIIPLQHIGRNSMIYYVAHFPIMHILSALNCKVFGIENDVLIFWYIIGGMSLILPILNYICHKPAMSWSIGIISKRK